MLLASKLDMGSQPQYELGISAYDPDKLGLGRLIMQSTGVASEDKFVGPLPINVARPMEAGVPIPYAFPVAIPWSYTETSQTDWVFLADVATAAVTRRIGMYTLDKMTNVFTYQGFITLTFPGTSEAKTIRGMRADYFKESTGTVSTSGAVVTGVSTLFNTNRICVGSRIGFGSTDPSEISTWYEVLSTASDTSLTLTTTPGVAITAGTPYVIEELRLAVIVTSVTTSLGGLYLVKGLRRELFTSIGGAVPAAVSTDKLRAVYHIKDASTGTALVALGGGMEEPVSVTSRFMWILETLANPILFKFDVRAALTVATGGSVSAFLLKTGAGGAVTGTASQLNNGRVAIANHGPGIGQQCLYFTTTTRIYRTDALSTITNGSTIWRIDSMTEVPPGGVNTFALGNGISSIEYSSLMDLFLITTSGAAGIRSYLTKYNTTGAQMNRIIMSDSKQIDHSLADSAITPYPAPLALPFTAWIEGGMCYLARFGTTAATNQIYTVPLGADWEYAALTGSRVIYPRIACANADNFVQAFMMLIDVIGGATGKNLGMPANPVRMYYRTSGIDDNSGGWTLLDSNGSMAGVAGAAYVQFMTEFRIDNTLIPGRVQNIGVLFNDISTDSHYQFSATKSSAATKVFAWRFSTAFGSVVPALKIRLYDAVSGALLLTDTTTASAAGTWQRSTDGTTFGAYATTDKGNDTTYISYAPTSLADNINIRPVLTLA